MLALLSAAALLHTHIDPLRFLSGWLKVLPSFIGNSTLNASACLVELWGRPSSRALLIIGALVGLSALAVTAVWVRRKHPAGSSASSARTALLERDPWPLAGLAAVLGAVAFYHRHYDNIMQAPALLAGWRLALKIPRLANLALAVLTGASLCCPQPLLNAIPGSAQAQTLIWTLLGISLLVVLIQESSAPFRGPPVLSAAGSTAPPPDSPPGPAPP